MWFLKQGLAGPEWKGKMSSLKNQHALADPACLRCSLLLSPTVKLFGSFLQLTYGSSWAVVCDQYNPQSSNTTSKTANGN